MTQKKQRGKGGGGVKYDWWLDHNAMWCYVSEVSFQTLTNFWEVTELGDFHDAELQQGTKEINGILNGLEKSNKDSTRKLSFVRFHNRLFLVWAKYGLIGQWDAEKTIEKALKLKVKRSYK